MNEAPFIEARCRTYNSALHGIKSEGTATLDLSRFKPSIRTRVINQLSARIRTVSEYRSVSGGLLALLEDIFAFKLQFDLSRSGAVKIPRAYMTEAKELVALVNSECAVVATPAEAVAVRGTWLWLTERRDDASEMRLSGRPHNYTEKILFSRIGPFLRTLETQEEADSIDKAIRALERGETITFLTKTEFTE